MSYLGIQGMSKNHIDIAQSNISGAAKNAQKMETLVYPADGNIKCPISNAFCSTQSLRIKSLFISKQVTGHSKMMYPDIPGSRNEKYFYITTQIVRISFFFRLDFQFLKTFLILHTSSLRPFRYLQRIFPFTK